MFIERTEFDYLLNAFELATKHRDPASQGYAWKREALFEYVRALEAASRSNTIVERVDSLERRVTALEAHRV